MASEPEERERWYAPFTVEQCIMLNGYQHSGYAHPYTCGNNSSHEPLIATRQEFGWYCRDCDYTQRWAHATNDPYGLMGLNGNELQEAILRHPWYAFEEDLIGGWCVMPVPISPSSGYPMVGSFLSEQEARHIAALHNIWLQKKHDKSIQHGELFW